MKEDILEQIVEDYLQLKGYFTRHNLKFRPREDHPDFDSKQDSNHSDIDALGFNPNNVGHDRVWAVNCKSWQGGLAIEQIIGYLQNDGKLGGKEAWKKFRELVKPKWSEAFIAAVKEATGSDKFTYVMAVAKVTGDPTRWEMHEPFQEALRGNPIRLVPFAEMLNVVNMSLDKSAVCSPLRRTLQLVKASGCTIVQPAL